MKNTTIYRIFLSAMICFLTASDLHSQTFTLLHSFIEFTNGANPDAGVILSGDTLYGTTVAGGIYGTVFSVKTNGDDFTILHTFTGGPDGANPSGGVIISSNVLYGAARDGGTPSYGTIFKIDLKDNTFSILHSFPNLTIVNGANVNSDGASPDASLILSDNALYGTANFGGTSGNGAIFKINTDGTGFTNLHSFTTLSGSYPQKNTDGAFPFDPLVLLGNTLYGTTTDGGGLGIAAR